MARGGARPGSGNPGYGKMNAILKGVNKLTPLWFSKIEGMMKGSDKNDQKFAISELSKLMGKMIPQQVEVKELPKLLLD